MKKFVVKSKPSAKPPTPEKMKSAARKHLGEAIHHVSHAAAFAQFAHQFNGGEGEHPHMRHLKKIKQLLYKIHDHYPKPKEEE